MNEFLLKKFNRLQRAGFLLGILGGIGLVLGAIFSRQDFFRAYLFGFLFWFDLTLGCLIVAMMHHLTGGRWGFVTRRIYEAGFMTLPLMLLFFIPIFFGMNELYPWTKPGALAASEELQHKSLYLNFPAFLGRTLFFFAVWIVMAVLLRKWSLAQDTTEDVTFTKRMRTLSGPGIVIASLTITGAYVDWVMSLEIEWYSTVFAVVIMGGQVLAAFALAVLLLALLKNFGPLSDVTSTLHFHQLGNLLLTFVMFWTYVSFGQLLIIWSGNLPREISWYLDRIAGNWKWLIGAVALFHFFLPFLLLLFRNSKRHVRAIVTISWIILVAHLAYVFWLIAPSFHKHGFWITWLDVAAPIGIGGFWVAAFIRSLKSHALLPQNDPRMKYEVAHAD